MPAANKTIQKLLTRYERGETLTGESLHDLQVEINELTFKCEILTKALQAARDEASNANAQLSTSTHFGDHSAVVRDAKLASHHLSLLQLDANKTPVRIGVCP